MLKAARFYALFLVEAVAIMQLLYNFVLHVQHVPGVVPPMVADASIASAAFLALMF